MSGLLLVLPRVQAAQAVRRSPKLAAKKLKVAPIEPRWAFYRKHTEGMLRRYTRFSLEAGRVPSMLGKEMFRGKVTSYRMESFDDLLIFVHDVDKCMARLDLIHQVLLTRIAMQEYTHEETAEMLRLKRMTTVRRYEEALDRLTAIFVEVGLLEPAETCQEVEIRKMPASVSLQGVYFVA